MRCQLSPKIESVIVFINTLDAHVCVGPTKGTYRRDIKMIVNHDYIILYTNKTVHYFCKKIYRLIILANIVYFPFN